ncbi:MAG: hypothetical protein IKW96_11110 [Ruminococcus sp.]|uniref:hypothetical protein n=1 Tax=Ruminococcus sp. TaxID=41978 RepID=UPI0025F971FF|nr:hypothetical protein [Ruminococcus sp.]MBR5683799.1 hypothetical protein [Ruminococcus sp.]
MRSYKEIADIVREQGDAILERRKIRAQRIKKISCAVSGLCAAVIVGVAVWHNSSLKKDPGFSGDDIVTSAATEAVTAETSAEVTTTASTVRTTAAKTTVSTVRTTQTARTTTVSSPPVSVTASVRTTAAATQSSEVNRTEVVTKTTQTAATNIHVTTSSAVHSGNTGKETVFTGTTTGVSPVMPATTTTRDTSIIQEGAVITSTACVTVPTIMTTGASGATGSVTRPVYTTTDRIEAFRTSYCTVTLNSITYEKMDSLVPENWVGIYIGKPNVDIIVSDETQFRMPLEVYEIADVSAVESVAVRLMKTDEYYIFRNIDRKKMT